MISVLDESMEEVVMKLNEAIVKPFKFEAVKDA